MVCLGLLLIAAHAFAAPRAWVDRDKVALDETFTLNVEAEGGQGPDFQVLTQDFELLGQSSQTSTSISNGSVRTSTLWAVALQPRRAGTLQIPAFTFAGASTEPIAVTVTAATTGVDAQGRDIFLETEIDDDTPYVGQPVQYVLRLNYAITLLNGDLDAPQTDGIDLRRIGDDKSYQREIAGRRYQTLERRFLLTPERSGRVELGAPRFRGQALGGARNALFGSARTIGALGAAITLDVRAQPTQAQSPWLPARSAQLRFLDPPTEGKVGVPMSVELQLEVEGVTAAQVGELRLPPIDGAQVFPDLPQTKEQMQGGRLTATITRRFAIVPSVPGELRIPSATLPWWNVQDDRGEQAQAEGFVVTIAASALGAVPGGVGAAPSPSTDTPDAGLSLRVWQAASGGFALLWLATLAMYLHTRRTRGAQAPVANTSVPPAPFDRAGLRRALAAGDLAAVEQQLEAAAAAAGLRLPAALAEPAQHAAYTLLQRARWRGDDAEAARRALREAFAKEIVWAVPKGSAAVTDSPLPPLWQ